MIEDMFGTVAATLTTVAFLPQAVKLIREKEVEAVSLTMYLIFTTGVVFWFIYGVMLTSYPMIFANIVTFILNALIICTKIKYSKKAP